MNYFRFLGLCSPTWLFNCILRRCSSKNIGKHVDFPLSLDKQLTPGVNTHDITIENYFWDCFLIPFAHLVDVMISIKIYQGKLDC
jgi:hypothetical protein